MLSEAGCEIVTGTDSLASSDKLSILSELKILQDNFPRLSLEELIKWATINGARALGETVNFGSIEPGKKPGLLLLSNMDLINLRLLPRVQFKAGIKISISLFPLNNLYFESKITDNGYFSF